MFSAIWQNYNTKLHKILITYNPRYNMNSLYLQPLMKNLKTITIILSLLTVISLEAQEKKIIKGFSGGMMVHTGYVFGSDYPGNRPVNISNATFGIGGCAKIHLTKHFRAGFEGYFSNAPLNKGMASGSFNKLFWAGALADWFWQFDKFYPYVGVTVGGGMETAFYMFNGNKHDWESEIDAVFHKQPFFCIDPYVGLEYAVGKALRLTLKADWMTVINSDGLNKPHGPRIYFGFIFAH